MKKIIKTILLSSILTILVVVVTYETCMISQFVERKRIIYFKDLDESIYAGIPVIKIETEKSKFPKDKETYINCSFSLTNTEEECFVSMKNNYGEEDSVGIRLRGNTTLSLDKKPFRVKFENKKSLLGLTEAKSWVLLADYFDTSRIRNFSSFEMGNKIFNNLKFVPHGKHVVLSINGVYQGLYLLAEQVDENKGRTDVECDYSIENLNNNYSFPFLVEFNSFDYEKDINGFHVEGLGHVEIKYPDLTKENIDDNRVVYEYIKEYVHAIYTTLKTGDPVSVSFSSNPLTFQDLVDEKSFIDWYLLNEFVLNRDACYNSIYISKKMDQSAVMGPVWDFDTEGVLGYDYNKNKYHCLEQKLCLCKNSVMLNSWLQNENNYNKFKTRWFEVKDKIFKYVSEELLNYKNKIYSAAVSDSKLWGNSLVLFDLAYSAQRMFLLDRVSYMTKTLGLDYEEFLEEVNNNFLKY